MSTPATIPATAPAATPAATAPAAAGAVAVSHPGWERSAFLGLVKATAAQLPAEYTLSEPQQLIYPFFDSATKRTRMAVAFAIDVTRAGATANVTHTVLLARQLAGATPAAAPTYFVWCGDQFLEGKLTPAAGAARIQAALRDVPMLLVNEMRTKLEAGKASHPANGGCSFWREYTTAPAKGGCKHVRGVFHAMCEDGAESILDHLDAFHDEVNARAYPAVATSRSSPFARSEAPTAILPTREAADAARAEAVALVEQELRKDKVIDEILDHTGPTVQGKMPLILIGDTGWGKTESFRIIKRSGIFDEVHEMQITPGMDAIDLVGGPQKITHRRADGTNEALVYHVDSPFVQAARAAAAGRKAAILFDELPRATRSFLSAIPAIINPDGDSITIATGRAVAGGVDGVANVERITFKRANLAIWATGNPGGSYDCNGFSDGGDLATINRFHRVYVRPDPDKAKRVIAELAKGHGWPAAASLAMTKWYLNMEKLADAKDSGITRRVSLRDIGWSFDMVRGNHQAMGKTLRQWTNRWAGFDLEGFPNSVQVKAIEDAITNAFGAAKGK